MTIINSYLRTGTQRISDDRYVYGFPFMSEIEENGIERQFECDFPEILQTDAIKKFVTAHSAENGTVIMKESEHIVIDREKCTKYGDWGWGCSFEKFLDLLPEETLAGAIRQIEIRRWLTEPFEDGEFENARLGT